MWGWGPDALWISGHPWLARCTHVHYRAIMSIKHKLARAVEELPDSTTLEEAFDRLYSAFKLKQSLVDALPSAPAARMERRGLLIPDEVVNACHLKPDELMREIAVLLFQQDRLTLGQASLMAGMTQARLQFLLASRQIPIHYGVDEFEADLQTLRELGRL